MATNVTALQQVVQLVSDAANDLIKSVGDATGLGKAVEFFNLMPDLVALAPNIGDIPTEMKALAPADYDALLTALVTSLNLPAGEAENVANAALTVIHDVLLKLLPDVEVLVATIKAPAVAPAVVKKAGEPLKDTPAWLEALLQSLPAIISALVSAFKVAQVTMTPEQVAQMFHDEVLKALKK